MAKRLIVVDMQNDFCKPGGVLYSPDAEAIIPNIAERCKEYDPGNVWFTMDSHSPLTYPLSIEGKTLPIHCVRRRADECGRDIVEELAKYALIVLEKPSFAYQYWDTCGFNDNDTIELCGTCTDICVVSNALALRSMFPGARIIVHADCCAGTSKEAHEAALKVMESCLIEVVR